MRSQPSPAALFKVEDFVWAKCDFQKMSPPLAADYINLDNMNGTEQEYIN